MESLILSAIGLGFLLISVGWIWGAIIVFRHYPEQAFGIVTTWLITFAFFSASHWEKAKGPFIVTLSGVLLLGGTYVLLSIDM